MVEVCCHFSLSNITPDWVVAFIAVLSLIVAYFSWLAYTKPVLIFYMSKDTGRFKLKNIGNSPAMNLLISYVVNENEPNKWINPIRCYSIKSGGDIEMDWVISKLNLEQLLKKHSKGNNRDDDKVFFVTNNKEVGKKARDKVLKKDIQTPGDGVYKYGVTYSSAFGILG